VWLATERFDPISSTTWQGVGVRPDVEVQAEWESSHLKRSGAGGSIETLLGIADSACANLKRNISPALLRLCYHVTV
jgi:hypothetical protein